MRWVSIIFCFALSAGYALPKGERVVRGEVSSETIYARELKVTASDKSIIEYDVFAIARGEKVTFFQPDRGSTALARVVGGDPSEIFGQLKANGHVFLVNPQGIYFGPNASVNVGGLVASTLDIADRDFQEGRYVFSGGKGSIVNRGEIRAEGSVAFLAPRIENRGVVIAKTGSVVLASAKAVTLDFTGDGLIRFVVDEKLVPDVGAVSMEQETAKDLVRAVVNVDGVEAGVALVERDGVIEILGGSQIQGAEVALHGEEVRMHDGENRPTQVFSGGGITLESEKIDLFMLRSEDSVIGCHGPLRLISDNPISADAHFASGRFSMEKKDGSPGDFFSLLDPIVSASGSVTFGDYTGASLFVQSTGQIAFTGAISINAADGTAFVPNDADTMILNASPSLILRSGLGALTAYTPELPVPPSQAAGGATFSSTAATPSSIVLGGNITTQGGPIILSSESGAGGIVLSDIVVMDSSGGHITFDGMVSSGESDWRLIVDARDTGDILFSNALSGGEDLTIAEAHDVTFAAPTSVGSLNQSAGSGTTLFSSTLDTSGDGGITLMTNEITFTGNVSTSGGGSIVLDNSGPLTLPFSTSSDGAFRQTGTGEVALSGFVSSNGEELSFAGPITLSTLSSLDSQGGDITTSTVDGGYNFLIDAGTGAVTMGVLGGTTPLAALLISTNPSSVRVASVHAASLKQSGGSGTSTYGVLNINGAMGIDLTGSAFTLTGDVTTLAGPMKITNSGLFTVAQSITLDIDMDFTQDGTGTNRLGGAVGVVGGDVTFSSATTLSGDLEIVGSNITFMSTLDGTTAGRQNLTVHPVAGDITLGVTGGSVPLGDVVFGLFTNSISVSSIAAKSLTQQSGSQASYGGIFTTGTAGVDLTGGVIDLTGPVSSGHGGDVTYNNSGLLTIAVDADHSLFGSFSQVGSGDVELGAVIATHLNPITFSSSVALIGDATLSSTMGNIILEGEVSNHFDLTLDAGLGSIKLMGNLNGLKNVNVIDARDVDTERIFSDSITQIQGSGTTTLNDSWAVNDEIYVRTTHIVFNAGVMMSDGVNYIALGAIRNGGVPQGILSTGIARFNALGGDVGSQQRPIKIDTSSNIFLGADGTGYLSGNVPHTYIPGLQLFSMASEPLVIDILSNQAAQIYFNQLLIKEGIILPIVGPTIKPSDLLSKEILPLRTFFVPGIYNQRYSLANMYYFVTPLYDETDSQREIPIFSTD